jgi:hypothetical protein
MKALYQRLKELDPATFEKLCFQIWSERLPGVELRHVEGKAGDKGTDLFHGVLANKPAIWQSKLFADGIKDAQKKQIKKSLKTALNSFKPSLWTLCIPVDLDINAHSWFQKLAQSHAAKVKIELFDASMIVKELIFRRPILSAFFPAAVLDVEEIKGILLGTGDYTDSQLSNFANETVEQFIERLRVKDPRYDYQMTYLSGNTGLAPLETQVRPPNTVVSLQQGNRRLDLVVRDVEALRKDPPRLTLELSAEGADKIQRAFSSGSPVELGQGELMGFRSSFDFLRSPEQQRQPYELLLTPKFRKIRESFRVSFMCGPDRIVYDLIEFDITGKPQEVEFKSASEHVPFHMHLNFGLDGAARNFDAETSFLGHDILEVQKFFNALKILRAGGKLELFDLKRQQQIGPFPIELTSVSEEREVFEELTDQLAEVARAFGQRLIAPDVINKKDLEILAFLLEVSRRGEIVGATVQDLAAKLVRREEPPDSVLGPLAGEFMIGLENENYPVQQLLGAQISVGPSRTIIEKASFIDFEEVKSRYEALSPGESMPVRFNSSGSVRQIFHRFYKGEPLASLVAV